MTSSSNGDGPLGLGDISGLEPAGRPPDKVELSGEGLRAYRGEGTVLALVKVARPGYVPPGCDVRARFGDQLFSAELDAGALRALGDDPLVVSVAVSRRLRTNEGGGG
jgi:hypothetical protein